MPSSLASPCPVGISPCSSRFQIAALLHLRMLGRLPLLDLALTTEVLAVSGQPAKSVTKDIYAILKLAKVSSQPLTWARAQSCHSTLTHSGVHQEARTDIAVIYQALHHLAIMSSPLQVRNSRDVQSVHVSLL